MPKRSLKQTALTKYLWPPFPFSLCSMCSSLRPTASGPFMRSWLRGWPLTWRAMSRQRSGMSSRFVFFLNIFFLNCCFRGFINSIMPLRPERKVNQNQNHVPPGADQPDKYCNKVDLTLTSPGFSSPGSSSSWLSSPWPNIWRTRTRQR